MASLQHLIRFFFRADPNEANMRRCRFHVYTRVQTLYFQLDAVSCQCIGRLFLPNIISQSICLSNISLMATSEHGEGAGIVASAPNGPVQPPLEPAIQVTTPQGSPDTVLNTSNKATRERERLPTSQISGAFFHYFA